MGEEREGSEWTLGLLVLFSYQLSVHKELKEVFTYDEADLDELIFSPMPLQWQTTYNLNKKGKIPERELTNSLKCIEQAATRASKPSEDHKGKGSWDSKLQEESWI